MAKKNKQDPIVEQAPMVEQPEPQATVPAPEPVQLTIADLQMISQIVDLASRRGAFQAGELSSVGTVYNKLAAFLVQVDAEAKATADAEAATKGE